MTMMTQTDPFSTVMSLRDAVNQLLEDSFVAPFNSIRPTNMIPVDVYETADAFVMKAFMPGLTAEQIDISIEQNTVTIQGQPQPAENNSLRTIWSEIKFAPFFRSFMVPVPVEATKVQAELVNGVLTVTLPKAETAKPRKIQVKALEASKK